MIQELHLKHVGPSPQFDVTFAERLNILTGDNGLGKTFLLDVVWWSLTGSWIAEPAWPRRGAETPEITWKTGGEAANEKVRTSMLDNLYHLYHASSTHIPGLVLYSRAGGHFAVADPIRNRPFDSPGRIRRDHTPDLPSAFHFAEEELWNGLRQSGRIVPRGPSYEMTNEHVLCKGLISDWLTWQYGPPHSGASQTPFELLTHVLQQLSPHPDETMAPGKPTRVSIEDVRDIPTINLPYGTIPIIYASAGMKRIIGLAYLLVWAWYEHQQAAFLTNQTPSNQILLIIDEVESHLHPRWQRSILPSLLEVATALNPQMHTQVITTTHSPLVLASVEPSFDEERDRLFLFEWHKQQEVTLREVPWSKQGDTVNWLVSDVFGLKQARSREAEHAIEAAEALMRGDAMADYPSHLQRAEQIHAELLRLLPGHDPFWPRWIVTTQKGTA